jgi:glycosyltransferase involved in cell wall biosynthesis
VINLPGPPNPRYKDDLRLADALVADGWAAEHLPGLLGCDVVHVPKGVDATLFSPDGDNRRAALGLSHKRVVIAVGRLVPIKNTPLLIAAMAKVRERLPNVHLIVVGEGPQSSALQTQIAELGLQDAVTLAGYVPLVELPALYRSADVFALSSKFDNSPNVVLEAMGAGLPVVATDVGGVRGFVESGKGADLVPSDDAQRFAEALVGWLESPERRAAASLHNRRVVLERYSWRASARRLLDVYDGVLSRRRRLSA